ncbi:hypothetical protein ACLOJK_018881 [Asimina triloba]
MKEGHNFQGAFILYDKRLFKIIEQCKVPSGLKTMVKFLLEQKAEHTIKVVSAPPLFENKNWRNIEEFKLCQPTKYSSLHVLLEIEGDLSPFYEGQIDLPRGDNVKAQAIGLQRVVCAAKDYQCWGFFRDEGDVLVKILDDPVKSPFLFWLNQSGARSQMMDCLEGPSAFDSEEDEDKPVNVTGEAQYGPEDDLSGDNLPIGRVTLREPSNSSQPVKIINKVVDTTESKDAPNKASMAEDIK